MRRIGYNVFHPQTRRTLTRDAPQKTHTKLRPDYSGAWDLEFMQEIQGASRLGVEYVKLLAAGPTTTTSGVAKAVVASTQALTRTSPPHTPRLVK